MLDGVKCPTCGTLIDVSKELRESLEKDVRQKAMGWAQSQIKERLEEEKKKGNEEVVALKRRLDDVAKREENLKKSFEEEKRKELEAAEKAMIDKVSKEVSDKKQKELDELAARLKEKEELEKKEQEEVKRLKDELEKRSKEQDDKFNEVLEKRLSEVKLDYEKRDREKESKLNMVTKQLQDAQRKVEQGSQQIQGESQEEFLEDLLRENFRGDVVEEVGKGIRGADVVHRVFSNTGKEVGVVLIESKNTKNWSDGWIKKLKDDMVQAKASVGVIVSSCMPDGVEYFGLVDGVWVTRLEYFLPLFVSIRNGLVELFNARVSLEGRDGKMELVYNYLSSADFKNKIENVVETFIGMKADLESEKRSMSRIWSKREKQLDVIINSTSMLYGDLEGILGNRLQKIEYFELPEGEEVNG